MYIRFCYPLVNNNFVITSSQDTQDTWMKILSICHKPNEPLWTNKRIYCMYII